MCAVAADFAGWSEFGRTCLAIDQFSL